MTAAATAAGSRPVTYADPVAERQNKAMRISIGLMLMAGFVLILFGLVTRYAGSWGVPYFSFTSERGSPCTNKLTGYICDPLTLADVRVLQRR